MNMSNRNDRDYGFQGGPSYGYGEGDGRTEYYDHGFGGTEPEAPVRSNFGKTMLIDDITEPDNEDGVRTAIADDSPKDLDGQAMQVVVGWLVGVEGACRGKDFRLHSGLNKVGRGSDMDISLGDTRISRVASVEVYYDPMSNQFYVGGGGGKCLSYVNRKLLMGNRELHPYDLIQLGIDNWGTVDIIAELLFVPLCGEQFTWAKVNAQEGE